MAKKLSHDDWLKTFTNDKVIILGTYTTRREKILVKCVFCGEEFESSPDNIKRGSGHKMCSDKEKHKKFRMSHEDYLSKLKDNAITDIIPVEEYQSTHTKILHKHIECGHEWNPTPASVLSGKGCPKCSHNYSPTLDEYLDILKNTDFELVGEYTGYTKKATHKHMVCGYMRDVVPYELIKNNSCPKCSGVIKRTPESYQKELKNFDMILVGGYKGMHEVSDHECSVCGHTRPIRPNDIVNNGVGCIKCNPNTSSTERELVEYIQSIYHSETLTNTRSLISPYEIDIYIPEHKLAIEFNGLYWHSEIYKDKWYHHNKWKMCDEQGIRLIQIFEDDWIYRQDIWKNKLRYLLGLEPNKIYARKCDIMVINTHEKTKFFNTYHIQGSASSSINLSLQYNSTIVACMSFKQRKSSEWELVRYATSCNVVGGFNKLMTYFKKTYEWTQLITFADLTLSNGDLYKNTAWEFDKTLPPDYQYIIRNERHHKFGFRHSQLKHKLENYDPTLSEHQNMLNHGICRIYDAGKRRFVLSNNSH